MRRFLLEITPELHAALTAACGPRGRNAMIERLLWASRTVREAARRVGVARPERPRVGRPRKNGEV